MRQKAEFIPQLDDEEDTSYFDCELTNLILLDGSMFMHMLSFHNIIYHADKGFDICNKIECLKYDISFYRLLEVSARDLFPS